VTHTEKQSNGTRSSRVIRFEGFGWADVPPISYKAENESWRSVTRHPLIGVADGTPCHVRYFEVEPGGYTTHERHEHQHVVVVLRGEGQVRLGDDWLPVRFGDVVFVASNDPHQFCATGDEPFGFLCIVSAERDRPVPL
jgi:quercetin dioxygenase-like cupin family protein